jgi:hypothetical protein
MDQSSASARESIPLSPVNIALVEDAARDLENAIEKIMAPGHWPSWSDPACLRAWPSVSAVGGRLRHCSSVLNPALGVRRRSWRST